MKNSSLLLMLAVVCQVTLQGEEPPTPPTEIAEGRGGREGESFQNERGRGQSQNGAQSMQYRAGSAQEHESNNQEHPYNGEGGAAAAGYERGMNQGNNNGNNGNPVYVMPEQDTQGMPGQPIGPQ